MTNSDRLLEAVYDLVYKQRSEVARLEVVRIALIAAQHRAAHIKDAGTPAHRAGRDASTRPATGD